MKYTLTWKQKVYISVFTTFLQKTQIVNLFLKYAQYELESFLARQLSKDFTLIKSVLSELSEYAL